MDNTKIFGYVFLKLSIWFVLCCLKFQQPTLHYLPTISCDTANLKFYFKFI